MKYALGLFGASLLAFPISALGPGAGARVVREIIDPATGDRWLLVRDLEHPGGPGRMVLAEAFQRTDDRESARRPTVVIRSGDLVVVEEHTEAVDLSLEGRALNSAQAGARLRVRLAFNGGIVQAVALRSGRAALMGNLEVLR